MVDVAGAARGTVVTGVVVTGGLATSGGAAGGGIVGAGAGAGDDGASGTGVGARPLARPCSLARGAVVTAAAATATSVAVVAGSIVIGGATGIVTSGAVVIVAAGSLVAAVRRGREDGHPVRLQRVVGALLELHAIGPGGVAVRVLQHPRVDEGGRRTGGEDTGGGEH